MNVLQYRTWFTEKSTISQCWFDTRPTVVSAPPAFYILEDDVLGIGDQAIPCGLYSLTLSWSPRFRHIMFELLSIPGRTGIRVHPGNTDEDTEGCLLPGLERFADMVTQSGAAHELLCKKILPVLLAGAPVMWHVRDARQSG